MKGRAIIPLVVGLVIGVFAIRSFLKVLNNAKGGAPAETVQVVRANADIAAMAEITPEMLELVEVPASLVPKDAFKDKAKVVGRVAVTSIPASVPLMPSLLAPEGTLPGMASRVPEGYRAVAIQVDEIKGVGGWLNPGCRVDVVMVADVENNGRRVGTISKTVLQNVEILAVGAKAESEGPKASVTRSVTVLVVPDDAAKLALAASKGKLQLTMRSQTDQGQLKVMTLTDKELLQDEPSRPTGRPDGESRTLLGQLFGKQRKIDQEQTDKQEAKPPEVIPAPAQVALAVPQEWVVDVLVGPDAYQVRFDSSGQNARRVGRTGSSGPRPGSLAGAAGLTGASPGGAKGGLGSGPAGEKSVWSDKAERDKDHADPEPRE